MAREVVRRWIQREVDRPQARALGQILQVSERTAALLWSRGIQDRESARRYLSPSFDQLPDPFTMKDMAKAAGRVAEAIERREAITLYGDYDVDGVSSTTLLASFLSAHGLEARTYIPKRLVEGYGLNREAVDLFGAEETRLLVSLDCGITAADEIAHANQYGIETIVVDHHRCPPELPPAFAVLNPHQEGCGYPEKVLAAVGVTFCLIIAVRKVLRERGYYSGRDLEPPNLRRFLDIVALGTVCDMVPLTGVNRVLTLFGLEELRWARRPGFRALMEVGKVKATRVSSGDLGFRLGPRINAAGRLDDASIGLRLLLSEDVADARRLAAALDDANGNRQNIEAGVYREATSRIDALKELPPAIVLADERWHPGVVGIVCSKLVERYDRPTILIGEGGRGSGRTARNVHLYDAVFDVASHLTKFGGHKAAIGLRIPFEKVEAFTKELVARVVADEGFDQLAESTLLYDAELLPEEVGASLYAELQRLEPFGVGNPEPLFRMRGTTVKSARVVGGQHLKLQLQHEKGSVEAIAFKMGELHAEASPGRALELACHVEENEFAGRRSVELRVRDLLLHTGGEDEGE